VGFEPTIPVFKWAKTVHALDCATTVIGTYPTYLRQFVKMRPAKMGWQERPTKGIWGGGERIPRSYARGNSKEAGKTLTPLDLHKAQKARTNGKSIYFVSEVMSYLV
jgi:hypothetical protein